MQVAENDDRELVNPYQNRVRPRDLERLGGVGVLRRRATQVLVLLISITLIAGTVATSCGAPPTSETSTE